MAEGCNSYSCPLPAIRIYTVHLGVRFLDTCSSCSFFFAVIVSSTPNFVSATRSQSVSDIIIHCIHVYIYIYYYIKSRVVDDNRVSIMRSRARPAAPFVRRMKTASGDICRVSRYIVNNGPTTGSRVVASCRSNLPGFLSSRTKYNYALLGYVYTRRRSVFYT